MRVGEVSEGNGMGWLSEMRGVRVGFKVYIYIYIYGFLVIFVLIGSGSGSSPSSRRVSLKPEPILGFILNIQTRPYCFTGWVKPTSLGSGGVGPDTHGLGTFCHT